MGFIHERNEKIRTLPTAISATLVKIKWDDFILNLKVLRPSGCESVKQLICYTDGG